MKTKKKVELVEMIIKQQKTRKNIIKMMNSSRSRCTAFITQLLGYNSWQDEKERKKAWDEAARIFKCMGTSEQKSKIIEIVKSEEQANDILETVELIAVQTKDNLAALSEFRNRIEKQMIQDVQQLTVSEWWFAEKGRGYLGLAVLIGEAGDLTGYANPAKLWKRFGVAVMDGIRQGGLPKNAPKELWIEHGHNKRRRSVLWTIGDCLLKTNGKDGQYRKVYDKRKAYEVKRLKKQWIAEGNKAEKFGPMQAHRRAQRYMEKRLLRDLWNEWNKAA